jgi:hypothetical protein
MATFMNNIGPIGDSDIVHVSLVYEIRRDGKKRMTSRRTRDKLDNWIDLPLEDERKEWH